MAGRVPAIHVFLQRTLMDQRASPREGATAPQAGQAGYDADVSGSSVLRDETCFLMPVELHQRAYRHVHAAQLLGAAEIRQIDDKTGGADLCADLA